MLISRRDGQLVLIEQNEHGRLAGELARHWGNASFAAPDRHDQTVLAAAMHDEGWREPDDIPLFNEERGRPLHFLEVERDAHAALYRRGVDRVFARDPYAGLLVSMHWTGLYRARWGMQAGAIALSEQTPVTKLQDDAIGAEEQRWIEVKRALLDGVRRSEFEAALWYAYDLMQGWDLLALFVSMSNLDPSGGAPPQSLISSLYDIDQVAGPRVIQSIPCAIGGERADLVLTAISNGVVAVDPYPFDSERVDLSVTGKTIPDRRYESPEEVRAALDAAGETMLTCRMVRGRRAPG